MVNMRTPSSEHRDPQGDGHKRDQVRDAEPERDALVHPKELDTESQRAGANGITVSGFGRINPNNFPGDYRPRSGQIGARFQF